MVWMDVCEAAAAAAQGVVPKEGEAEEEETTRPPPLVPVPSDKEKNNAINRRSKTREVTSRYNKAGIITSPSLLNTVNVAPPKRCPSPTSVTRPSATSQSHSLFSNKRSHSAERRRPATPPPSPPRPSTPIQESSAEMQISSRRLIMGAGRTPTLPEGGLWPSTTMRRSLSVSFQSDTFSLPITTKREKPPVNHYPSSDHTTLMKSSSANVVAHYKQAETPPAGVRNKATTPERKRTPLRGKNSSSLDHQSENSRPVDINSSTRVVDQQQQQLWPGRIGGKLSTTCAALTRSMDLTEKKSNNKAASSLPFPGRGVVSPWRRTPTPMSADGLSSRPLEKSVIDNPRRVSFDGTNGRVEFEMYSAGISSKSSVERTTSSSLIRAASRTQSLPISGSPRLPSPSRASVPSSSTLSSRAMLSPSRTRPSTPFPSVVSSSLTSRSSSNSSSVLSFNIADVRKGRKTTMNHIEDAHQLRLLYNRYLQWRFANARGDTSLSIQKMTAEETLFNVWRTTSELWDSVTMKRINLQQLRQELKLNSVLNEQIAYLDDWVVLERDHLSSLAGAIEALEACTLRIPVSGGARADIVTVKDAICSALDVMQAMGSSIWSLLSRVEGFNHLVSELASVAAQERTVLDECRDLLASTATMQMEENSHRTHLIQLEQALRKGEQPLLAVRTLG